MHFGQLRAGRCLVRGRVCGLRRAADRGVVVTGARWLFAEALPLGASGKVQKRSLRALLAEGTLVIERAV